jgi:hypothetical protein
MPWTNRETLLRKDICHIICLTNVSVSSRAGKYPAAPAAPLPGNF